MTSSFNGGYRPPGVYVDNIQSGSLPSVGLGGTTPCLIGRGRGYVATGEQIQFAGSSDVELLYRGIDVSTLVVRGTIQVSGVPTLTTFDLTNDYTVVVGPETDGPHTSKVTLHRVATSGGTIPLGVPLTVTYRYTDANYFGLRSFENYTSVVDVYGPALDPITGALVSPLTLAAGLVFGNGGGGFYAIATDNTGSTTEVQEFTAALAKLVHSYDVNVVVPLFEEPTDKNSFLAAVGVVTGHLTAARSEAVNRIVLLGASAACAFDPGEVAALIDSQDVVLLWPQRLSYYNPITTAIDTVDGFYAAAAAAGVLMNQSVNRGLTQSALSGFGGFPATTQAQLTRANRDAWSSQGVAVMEIDRLLRLVIRDGTTTDTSSVQTKSLNVVREQYALMSLIQRGLAQADLIGDPITLDTPLAVKAIVVGALETALQANIITEYDSPTVQQQQLPDGDPTIMRVSFPYRPTYPLNIINVVMTLNLSSGATDTTTTTTT